jgi:hypothetical protein
MSTLNVVALATMSQMLKPASDKGLRMHPLERQNRVKSAVYAGRPNFYDTVVLGNRQTTPA